MRSAGGLVFLISLGLILIVGINAFNGATTDITDTGDIQAIHAVTSVNSAINPLFLMLGFVVLIVGAYLAINAFS